VVEQRDPSITVDGSGHTQTEDILGRRVGLGQVERAEEAVAFLPGPIETDTGNLFGGGVDLAMVVAIYLLLEHSPNIFHLSYLLQGAGANNAILQPLVRSLDLSFGLRR
jgi:hypothetical protein